ncbi:MAG: cadmium-translocating P-type ATPase [Peptococcaceae bacterium]|nr:cadmium-translocating P-type ATPase [Peptococcaceae bacterium]
MERIYFISGLDCANCAAKLERHLREITYFDNVIIDFMAQKLILTAKDTEALQKGLQEALQVIARVEPGVTIAEKAKMKKSRASQTRIRQVTQDAHCGCDYKHEITQDTHCHDEHCSCGHEHHHNHEEHTHHHDGYCSCGHEHHHAHEEHIHQHNEHCHCGQEHYHEHEELMYNEVSAVAIEHVQKKDGRFTNEMKQGLVKISISTVLFFAALLLDSSSVLQLGVYLLAYFIVGSEVLLRAAKNILRGQVFDENFLMSIATVGAFCIGEYPEGVMVMLLYQLGELFQNYAVQRSRRSIAELMDIKPEVAHIKMSGQYIDVEPEEVTVGDIIQVRPGERIPLDGVVLEGHSALNTVALTGESVPREVGPQEVVMSGCINTSGVLLIQVEKEYDDSTVAKILDLVENASSKKAETENFITRFARFYTPIVVVIAAILAVVPPMILHEPFSGWVYRALVFLVISCPCALVISIPLTFFSGLGVCSRHGVLVKGSNYLEALAQMETAVFDKTGTLTQGQFTVTEVHPIFMAEHELLYYAACAESISNHPIAEAIRKANQQSFTADVVQRAEELAGHGVSAMIEGHHVLAGNYRLMEQYQIDFNRVDAMDTIVYIAIDRVFRGWIRIADTVKPDAKEMVAQLKTLGVHNIVMLTGDNQNTAEQVAKQLGITKIFSQLLPGDKVACLEQLLAKKSPKATVAFTGDGLNDAPVLARADVGIAMGGLGSDAAIEAADVVIMNDQPSKLADAVRIARKTRTIVTQNIVFVLAIKFLVLLLGALGHATMWMAVFADVGVAFLAILNAVRIMKY